MISRIVFSVTYDCPISCRYCVTRSGPWQGPFLDSTFMISVIDQALALGNLSSVVFTGGEPLLKKHEVVQVISHAKEHGLWTRIVTNSFWASTPDCAVEFLGELKEAGLCEINLSCDDLHQEHIPLEQVRNAFQAACKLELPALIAHKQIKEGVLTPASIADFLGVELTEFKEGRENPTTNLYISSLTVPVGHGADSAEDNGDIVYPPDESAWSAPCSSILSSVIVSPAKEVRICCGMIEQHVPELTVGSLERQTLSDIVYQANTDLIANWLALEGPYGIMNFARDKSPQLRFRERNVNHCHLCNDLFTRDEVRKVLMEHSHEKLETVSLQRGFLEALRFKEKTAGQTST